MFRCLLASLIFLTVAPHADAVNEKAIEAAYFVMTGVVAVAKSDDEIVVDKEVPPEPSGVKTVEHERVTRVGRCVFERRMSRATVGARGESRVTFAEFERIDFSRFRALRHPGGDSEAEVEAGFSCITNPKADPESVLRGAEPLECDEGRGPFKIVYGSGFDRDGLERAIERLRKEQCVR
jgi:hypothetical protein